MQSSSSHRPHLLPPIPLAVLGLAIATVLLALRPRGDALDDRVAATGPHGLSVHYLQLALATKPDDASTRLLLARQAHLLGRFADAEAVLAPLVDEPTAAGDAARLLRVENVHARCIALPPDGDERRACTAELLAEIRACLGRDHELAGDALTRLAEIGLAAGDPGLAGDIQLVLAQTAGDAALRRAWWNRAAESYLRGGDPERAARVYADAADALPRDAALPYRARALAAITAADRPRDGLAMAARFLDRWPGDDQLLAAAVSFALAGERPDVAAQLGRDRLALRPDDPALVAEQLRAELAAGAAAGENGRALALARRLVALTPDSREAREQLAHVAEWSGQPLLALDQWAWLARRHGGESTDRAIALARAQWDQELLLGLISWPAGGGDGAGTLEVAELLVRLGRPEQARDLIERYLAAHPGDRPAWDALLAVNIAMVDRDRAATVFAQIDRRFGTSELERRRWAELLWRARRPDEALAVLQTAPPAQADTLRMQARLALRLDRIEDAVSAYASLWRQGELVDVEADQLVALARVIGDTDLAIAVAVATWDRSRRPESMLAALGIAADAGRWDELGRLEAIAADAEWLLRDRAEYWRVRALLRLHRIEAAIERDRLWRAGAIADELASELVRAADSVRGLAEQPEYRQLVDQLRRHELYLALERRDLDAAERALAAVRELDPAERSRLRLSLGHWRLRAALERDDVERAAAIADDLEREIARAFAREGELRGDRELWRLRVDVRRQRLNLALRRADRATVDEIAGADDGAIPRADRVHALRWLGREEQAARLAVAPCRADRAECARLATHAGELVQRLPRHAGAHVRVVAAGGEQLTEVAANARYTWNRLGVGAGVRGRSVGAPASASAPDDVELLLHGRRRTPRSTTELAVGGRVSGDAALARIDAFHRARIGSLARGGAALALNQIALETGDLRGDIVRDRASAWAEVSLSDHVFLHGALGGQIYHHLERGRLGAGVDVETSAGYRVHGRQRSWNVRLVGVAAPRFAIADAQPGIDALPRGAGSLTVATTVSRGELGRWAAPTGRLRYFAEVSGGWLIPDGSPALAASAGVGVPLAGGELSLAAEYSNFRATAPGHARHGAVIEYVNSLWH